jgi:hypothetical protein
MKLEIEELKLNQKQSEVTSQEEINNYGDLADDTNNRKKLVGRYKITKTIYRKLRKSKLYWFTLANKTAK